jgi:hypothetical protein
MVEKKSKGKQKKKEKENIEAKQQSKFKSDLEILEKVKNKIVKKIEDGIENGNVKLKVGDLLKVIEMQRKISSDTKAEEKFWEMVEQIRQEELKDEK